MSSDPAARTIRLIVVDDQAIIREGLVLVLSLLPDVDVVGEAADGLEAVALASRAHPDVVLMDLRMPGLDGVGATELILAEAPETAILVLTTFADDESIMRALRAGARGYLTKDADRGEVAAAVRAVARGQSTFSPEVGALLVQSLVSGGSPAHSEASRHVAPAASGRVIAAGITPESVRDRFPALTPRETEVLALIAEAKSNSEIAARMFVSVATVKTHINAIFAKLDVSTRAQAIAAVRS